jgi:hypothetical protein
MKNHSKTRFSFVLFCLALVAAIACWKQIGISPAAMQQGRAVLEAAKAKVQTVCKDESLTPQQKKEQIHQIHEEPCSKPKA